MLTSHDFYCRCRLCKPPLVGQASPGRNRLTMIAFALIAVGAVLVLR